MWFVLWRWFKKYWMWVLFPVGIAAFFWRLTSRPSIELVSSETTGMEEELRQEREKARQAILEAEAQRQAKLDEVRQKHNEMLEELTEAQRQKVKELESDPDELNEFLLDVGHQIRNR